MMGIGSLTGRKRGLADRGRTKQFRTISSAGLNLRGAAPGRMIAAGPEWVFGASRRSFCHSCSRAVDLCRFGLDGKGPSRCQEMQGCI
jgi:hypothetical protein